MSDDYYQKGGKKYDAETDERIIKQGGKTYRQGSFGEWEADKDWPGNDKVERDWAGNPKVERDWLGNEVVEKDWLGNPVVKSEDKKSSGGCFISSACLTARGLPDDCAQLRTLRVFRDEFVSRLPEGRSLVARYCEIAPAIVDSIGKTGRARSIYEKVYTELIVPTVELINAGRSGEALEVYANTVRDLEESYLPD